MRLPLFKRLFLGKYVLLEQAHYHHNYCNILCQKLSLPLLESFRRMALWILYTKNPIEENKIIVSQGNFKGSVFTAFGSNMPSQSQEIKIKNLGVVPCALLRFRSSSIFICASRIADSFISWNEILSPSIVFRNSSYSCRRFVKTLIKNPLLLLSIFYSKTKS